MCTTACETAGQRTFTQTQATQGNGAACPTATDCGHGDGQCVVDRDCQGTWSACTTACETAGQRTFTQTQVQQGNGAACPAATDCVAGDGQCSGHGCGTVLKATIGWTGAESVVANVQSSGECCDYCKKTASCIGWVYNNDKYCYQKKAASAAGISLVGGPEDPQNTIAAGLIASTGVDCQGSWSACTSACEKASTRTWTEVLLRGCAALLRRCLALLCCFGILQPSSSPSPSPQPHPHPHPHPQPSPSPSPSPSPMPKVTLGPANLLRCGGLFGERPS